MRRGEKPMEIFKAIRFKLCSHKYVKIHGRGKTHVSMIKCHDCDNYIMVGPYGNIRMTHQGYYEFALSMYDTVCKMYNISGGDLEVPEKKLSESVPFYEDFLKMKLSKDINNKKNRK